MNKRERDKWAKALRKCIEQDDYGYPDNCSLCQIGKKDCLDCICFKYASKGCVGIMNKRWDPDPFPYFWNQHKRFIRFYLRKMLAWVEAGAKPRRK